MTHSYRISLNFDLDFKDFSYDTGLEDVLRYQHKHSPIRSMPRKNVWGRQNPTKIEGIWGRTLPTPSKPKETKIGKSHPIFDNAPTSKSNIQDIFSKVFARDMSHSN